MYSITPVIKQKSTTSVDLIPQITSYAANSRVSLTDAWL